MKVYGYCPYEDLSAIQPIAIEGQKPTEPPPKPQVDEKRAKVKAKYERQRDREKKLLALRSDPSDHRHGTLTGYQCGCRCDRCWAAYKNRYESRKLNNRRKIS